MTRWLLVLALLLAPVAQSQSVVGLQYRITRVDAVERQFYGVGQRLPVVCVFSTVYRIAGRVVKPSEFWRRLRPGDVLDAKVLPRPLFAIAVAADINLR